MENQDSICYINKITSIAPIKDADKIELATVNGWTSVVAKGFHKEGDLVLCIVTDGVIPDHLAEKWGVKQYLRKGNRVRTIKLKGVYSEAILIPLFDVANVYRSDKIPTGIGGMAIIVKDGEDMMSNLGIFKYEEPENTHTGTGKGPQTRNSKNRLNQNFNKYYKFPNIKNVPNMFDENDDVIITRKIHGSNARYAILKKTSMSVWDRLRKFFGNKEIEYEYVYGSHNVQKIEGVPGYYKTDVWGDISNRYKMKEHLWNIARELMVTDELGKGITVYGEIYGPGIQGKEYTYGETETQFRAFDIELDGEYLDRMHFDRMTPCQTVEVLYRGKWSKDIQDHFVLNQYINGTKIPHEGVVISSPTGDRRKMAKVINPEYHTYAEKHHVPDGH